VVVRDRQIIRGEGIRGMRGCRDGTHLVIGDRVVNWVWEMAFFMVLLGWSWGVGLWLFFAKSERFLKEGGRERANAVLVGDADMDGVGLSRKESCGGRVHSLRAF
jgi:hypothetical protein